MTLDRSFRFRWGGAARQSVACCALALSPGFRKQKKGVGVSRNSITSSLIYQCSVLYLCLYSSACSRLYVRNCAIFLRLKGTDGYNKVARGIRLHPRAFKIGLKSTLSRRRRRDRYA